MLIFTFFVEKIEEFVTYLHIFTLNVTLFTEKTPLNLLICLIQPQCTCINLLSIIYSSDGITFYKMEVTEEVFNVLDILRKRKWSEV